MKLAELKKKRERSLLAAHKRVLSELAKLERQALKAINPLVKSIASLQGERASAQRAALAGQGELASAWAAALKARRLYANIFEETLMGEDEEPGLAEPVEGAFEWVDLPNAEQYRNDLEEKLREAFTEIRDKAEVNFEVEA